MTEQRFDELINLYLDNEIGRSDVGELKHAMKDNLVRRRKFERACQLHQAARKVLGSPSSGGHNEDRLAGGGNPNDGSRARKFSPSSLQDAVKSKQNSAHRNASVGALAERQEKQGVASTVEMDKISLISPSRSQSPQTGGARNFTFFDSPVGRLTALLLCAAVFAGLYLILRAATPAKNDDPGNFSDASPVSQAGVVYDSKAAEELAAEVKKHNTVAMSADPMQERLYQSALTGEASSNDATSDNFSSHLDLAPPSNASGNGGVITPTPDQSNTINETNPPATTPSSAPSP